MSNILKVSKNDELDKAIQENKYVVLDFYADWCGPCKALAPVIQDVSKELDDVTFIKIDVDHAEELKNLFKISSIPTLVYFKNGQEVNKTFGFIPKPTLLNNVNNLKSDNK
ncbi:thioredoxin [Spiroplasma platyhelix]|uniref:Thioredoxin n=1 Tax=Spiroplasma platyhelix PALS-1 TaxID=1276218 RepID=A0A846U8L1_9MOLU|nr:thioredoxin [Spiroplasma platyhelix]MBE4703840.1 Thioredoxin [Spiroplasma platyhelix PALS-1]NKE38213.1 thioredoxin [Spiroplasma platyhelix PALS-1]UJB29098.1 thioredoxin [Spiroplasma platyhelix PALS-1]